MNKKTAARAYTPATPDMRMFAVYSRKSKFTGKGESVENQVTLSKEYIMQHYPGVREEQILVFEDEGYSGGNLFRPQFAEMMEAVRANQIQAVICYRLDRISRNIGDFAKLIDELAFLQVSFVSIREQFDTSSPMGKAMMYIASVFSQLERETIAERIRDNLHELGKTGRWLGGVTPTGYTSESIERVTVDGKVRTACKLKEIPSELELIDLIFDKMDALRSLTKTETYLLRNHCKTKNGKDFTRFTIKSIVSNPVYMVADEAAYNYFVERGAQIFAEPEEFDGSHGVMVYNRTHQVPHRSNTIKPMEEWFVSIGKHVGRIPSDLWIRVNKQLEDNRKSNANSYRRQGDEGEALLSGLLRCSCGDFMRPKAQMRTNSEGNRVFYYVCSMKERSRGARCSSKPINGNFLDKWVCAVLKSLASEESEWKKKMQKSRAYFRDSRSQLETDLDNMRRVLDETDRAIQGLVGTLAKVAGTAVEDHIIKQIEEMDGTRAQTKQRLDALEAQSENSGTTEAQFSMLEDVLSSVAKTVDTMTLEQKRAAIRAVAERIAWDGEQIHLYLFGSDDSNGMEFTDDRLPTSGVGTDGHRERIANEVLMFFRSQRKSSGEVSLSDSLDADGEGNSLSLMDVISVDDDMLDNLDARDSCLKVRKCVGECLNDREAMIINLRYGLGGRTPLTQREIASQCGISRSYVSRIEKKALKKLEEAMGGR